MARKKEYIEDEVIEKAMHLFWRNGYETTSVRMLEKEMGINQFSIYSSFGNKQGVFMESIKCYRKKVNTEILNKLRLSQNGVEGIKQYFYDFLEFSNEVSFNKGCLLTNTVNELGSEADKAISTEILKFATNVRSSFVENLNFKSEKSAMDIEKQANYLMIALQGLSVGSKMFDKKQLEDFIEGTFINI